MIRDEAQPSLGADDAHAPEWALWHHQFDLKRTADGSIYLTRWWLVKTPLGGIALHRMSAPDARPTLHDHPFSFLSVVLRGSYYEHRLEPRTMRVTRRWVTRFNLVRKHDAHTIAVLGADVVWTLLFVGKHRRTWGFWEPDVFSDANGDGSVWHWIKHDAYDSGHYAA